MPQCLIMINAWCLPEVYMFAHARSQARVICTVIPPEFVCCMHTDLYANTIDSMY
jgi:hypothetical protein